MFHTFVCHSIEVAHAWNRMDYVGIVVLISGSFVSYTHYGFFCDPALRNLYIALIYSASAGAFSSLSPTSAARHPLSFSA